MKTKTSTATPVKELITKFSTDIKNIDASIKRIKDKADAVKSALPPLLASIKLVLDNPEANSVDRNKLKQSVANLLNAVRNDKTLCESIKRAVAGKLPCRFVPSSTTGLYTPTNNNPKLIMGEDAVARIEQEKKERRAASVEKTKVKRAQDSANIAKNALLVETLQLKVKELEETKAGKPKAADVKALAEKQAAPLIAAAEERAKNLEARLQFEYDAKVKALELDSSLQIELISSELENLRAAYTALKVECNRLEGALQQASRGAK
jgi:hypothetical protein